MESPLRILIVEDLPTDVEIVKREIKKANISCIFRSVDTREDFISALNEFKPDLILSDYSLPQFDGMQALHLTKELDQTIPFIIVTGSMNEEIAVKCIKEGADDYVIKEHIRQLAPAILSANNNKQNLIAKLEAEKALRVNEQRLHIIVETSSDGIVIINKGRSVLFANQKAKEWLSGKNKQIIGSKSDLCLEPSKINECDIIRSGGIPGKAEISLMDIKWDNEPAFLLMLHDITNRKLAEEKINKLNRLYAVLSSIEKTIVYVKGLNELFNKVCKVAVESGLYKMVWIGLVDQMKGSIKPAAWNGNSIGYIENLEILLHYRDELLGTAGSAVNENRSILYNDIQHDEATMDFRQISLTKNFNSVLSIPIRRENNAIGVITFYSELKDAFDEQEIKLLEELAQDLSFAAQSIGQLINK